MSDKNNKPDKIIKGEVSKDITRKEAIKKAGKYAAVTVAVMFIVLSPKESQAASKAPPVGW